jgi:hypothetical protein
MKIRTIDKIRLILNIVFLIGAVATVAVYATCGNGTGLMYVGFTTLSIKFFEFVLRFVN